MLYTAAPYYIHILYSTAFIADLTLHLHVESHSTVTQLFHLCPPIDPAHLWLRSPDNRLYSVQSVAHALAPPCPPMAPPCPPLAPPCRRQAVHCSVSSSCSGSNAHLWLHPAHDRLNSLQLMLWLLAELAVGQALQAVGGRGLDSRGEGNSSRPTTIRGTSCLLLELFVTPKEPDVQNPLLYT